VGLPSTNVDWFQLSILGCGSLQDCVGVCGSLFTLWFGQVVTSGGTHLPSRACFSQMFIFGALGNSVFTQFVGDGDNHAFWGDGAEAVWTL